MQFSSSHGSIRWIMLIGLFAMVHSGNFSMKEMKHKQSHNSKGKGWVDFGLVKNITLYTIVVPSLLQGGVSF
jgi:hypothetical protein